jgi:hypothetical protein
VSIGLGFAILLSAILFIIDRNHAWPATWRLFKRASKVVAMFLILGSLVGGIWYIHSVRVDREAAAESARQIAAEAQAQSENLKRRQAADEETQRAANQRIYNQFAQEQESSKRLAAQKVAAREEHIRRISLIRVQPIWTLNEDSHDYDPKEIQITNGTPEIITSITFGTYMTHDEQPKYIEIEITIEPGKVAAVPYSAATCCTSDYIPGARSGQTVFVKDYKGRP